MALKVYVSGMSGNKEVKKRQQRVLMILDSKNVKYDLVDITEPGKEAEKDMMQTKSTSNGATVSDPNPRHPLPPQIFNDDEYCGDYDAFDLANEIDTLEQFLKLAPADTTSVSTAQIELKNGEKETTDAATTEPAEENKENEENKEKKFETESADKEPIENVEDEENNEKVDENPKEKSEDIESTETVAHDKPNEENESSPTNEQNEESNSSPTENATADETPIASNAEEIVKKQTEKPEDTETGLEKADESTEKSDE